MTSDDQTITMAAADLRAKVKALPTVPSLYDGIPILPDPATIAGVLALLDASQEGEGSGKPDPTKGVGSGKALADLRAKVEDLPPAHEFACVWLDDVLALLDGGSK
jgi:hypothetical protein